MIRDASTDLAFLNIKQSAAKRHRIGYLSILLAVYEKTPTQEIRELLTKEGFRVTDSHSDTCRMVYGKLKKMQDDQNYKDTKAFSPERTDFDKVISEVEQFQGYGFDQDKMSVKHFANIYKRYNERKDREKRHNQ